MTPPITRDVAQKVRDIVDAGLVAGVGVAEPGKLCVEAAVCLALGLPHGDDPRCVSPALRRLKIGLNDRAWSSPTARAKGLRRLAVAQLGSFGVLDDQEFVRRVVEMTIRRVVPAALRSAARVNPTHADELEAAAGRCEREGTLASAANARHAAANAADADAYAAAADAYAYAAANAAYAAAADAYAYAAANAAYLAAADAYAAAAAAADAANAAYAAAADAYAYAAAANAADAYAADADAYAAANAAYAAAADANARDTSLAHYAEWVVEILIDMQAPGCAYLDLVPLEAV